MKKIILILLLALSVYGAQYKVVKIVDGDTIKVSTEEGNVSNIRFAHVDTPEKFKFSYKARGDIKRCGESTVKMGYTATKHLSTLVKKGDKVDLKFIGETSHDRDVAIIYINKVNLNSKMVQDGYAIVWHRGRDIQDKTYKKYLLDAEYEAITKTTGFWKTNPVEMTCLEEYHK